MGVERQALGKVSVGFSLMAGLEVKESEIVPGGGTVRVSTKLSGQVLAGGFIMACLQVAAEELCGGILPGSSVTGGSTACEPAKGKNPDDGRKHDVFHQMDSEHGGSPSPLA